MAHEIGIDFGKDHAQNYNSTASFARPKGRAALSRAAALLNAKWLTRKLLVQSIFVDPRASTRRASFCTAVELRTCA
ncbi:hypothetical protein CIT26_28510 [Mesorhizobium temperatum]|uniref:Uncharacterized protein n=1 Tax=Mesorhizobium temperatum TaxID=241416 RepID=A0A271LDD0_9HYPH|nr:hypothetical protein CIT26_28510 [Mesorhizobium temperatum]